MHPELGSLSYEKRIDDDTGTTALQAEYLKGMWKTISGQLLTMNSSLIPYTGGDDTLNKAAYWNNSQESGFPFHKMTVTTNWNFFTHLLKMMHYCFINFKTVLPNLASLKMGGILKLVCYLTGGSCDLNVNALNNSFPLCFPFYVWPRENVIEFTPK